jgi:hypothetical protein
MFSVDVFVCLDCKQNMLTTPSCETVNHQVTVADIGADIYGNDQPEEIDDEKVCEHNVPLSSWSSGGPWPACEKYEKKYDRYVAEQIADGDYENSCDPYGDGLDDDGNPIHGEAVRSRDSRHRKLIRS